MPVDAYLLDLAAKYLNLSRSLPLEILGVAANGVLLIPSELILNLLLNFLTIKNPIFSLDNLKDLFQRLETVWTPNFGDCWRLLARSGNWWSKACKRRSK